MAHARVAAETAAAEPGRPSGLVQRACAACRDGEECESCSELRLQRRAAAGGGGGGACSPSGAGAAVHRALASAGRPLDGATRRLMESRFATGFADVRLHDGPESHAASRALRAEAFTCGQQVHFSAGRLRPHTRDGLHLLAHELAHTVQQRTIAAPGGGRLAVDAPASPLEQAADRAAARAIAGLPAGDPGRAGAGLIQRKSAEVEKIDDLLSYGLFDWAIRDAEAVEALTRLKGLPRITQAEFMSDPKFADRLRDNLPDARRPEFDAIAADVKSLLPDNSKVEAIIDKLSYGLFDWAITDREAEEALDALKTLSGEQLAIALKRIDYGRLMDNLPAARHQELIDLLSAGLGSAGTYPTEEAAQPGTALRSLDFTTDHPPMIDNDKDWSAAGKPFPRPLWAMDEKGKARSGAISHTMDRQIGVELGLDVVPERAPAAAVKLSGKGTSSFLNFDFSGTLQGGKGQRHRILAQDKLPAEVAAHRAQSILWAIDWGGWKHEIGTTGPFDIYTTVNTPKRPDQVTTKRMAQAVKMVALAPTLKPHDVVKDIMFTWPEFNLDVRYTNEWDLAGDLETGAQCIDIVRFVQSVIGMVGLDGIAEAVVIWAHPSAPTTALEAPWGSGGMYLVGGRADHPAWRIALLDGNFRPNNFEAALKLTADGKTIYYPGGVQATFDNADDVLGVFNCLAWFEGAGGKNFRITEVPGPYQPGMCVVGAVHSFEAE